MHKLEFKIRSVSALVLPTRAGDVNMVSTRSYINGSAILGAFASAYIGSFGLNYSAENKLEFDKIFINSGVIFSNAYINLGEKKSIPTPLSFFSKKHKADKVYDMLLADDNGSENLSQNGGYVCIDEDKETILPVNVEKSINFHFRAGNYANDDKIIFNYESIKENQDFSGRISGEAQHLKKLRDLFKSGAIRLGKSKSAQYGLAEISFGNIEEIEQSVNVTSQGNVTMTFLSDTIIYNDFGSSVVDLETLEKIIGVKICKSYIKKSSNDNFMSIWKLRKPSEQCFMAGSSFLLAKVPDDYEMSELGGIGERVNEGFGQVEFGIQKSEEYYVYESARDAADQVRPKEVPNLSAKILIRHIKNKLEENARLKGFEAAEKIKKMQSGSLIKKIIGFTKNMDEFCHNIQNLRNTSKNKLKYILFEDSYLYDFLAEPKSCDMDIKHMIETSEIANGINYAPQKDDELVKHLKQVYIESLFTQLYRNRKINKII